MDRTNPGHDKLWTGQTLDTAKIPDTRNSSRQTLDMTNPKITNITFFT
jgi:hypothetical protein